MGTYFLTGRPGTGKSYVTQRMVERGLQAYDLEEVPGIIRLESKETGEQVEWPEGFMDWSQYAWQIQRKPLLNFLGSLDGDIYVSCSANNQTDFYELCDEVFVLTLNDPSILRHRLETRNVHEHGQAPENINRAVEKLLARQADLLSHGGIAIDSNRPIDIVIDEIINFTHDH